LGVGWERIIQEMFRNFIVDFRELLD